MMEPRNVRNAPPAKAMTRMPNVALPGKTQRDSTKAAAGEIVKIQAQARILNARFTRKYSRAPDGGEARA